MSEENTLDPVTALAVDMGYNPDFDGENKKTPEEFIKRGVKIQRNQSEKIKDLLGRMDGMSSEFQKMQDTFDKTLTAQQEKHKVELEQKKAALETRMETAVDEADLSEVKRVQKEMADVDKQASDIKPNQAVSKEQEYFNNWWSDKKSWLLGGSDAEKEMNKAIALFRIEKTGNATQLVDVKQELAAAEEHLKKKFPEQFGLKPEEKPPGGAVGEGKTKGGSKRALKFSDLSADEKKSFNKWKRLQRDKFDEKKMLNNISLARQAEEK